MASIGEPKLNGEGGGGRRWRVEREGLNILRNKKNIKDYLLTASQQVIGWYFRSKSST